MKRTDSTSVSVIFTLSVDLWELKAIELKRLGTGSKFVQKIRGDRLDHWQARKVKDENLADLCNVLLTALQLKKLSGRCRWHVIPTQR